MGARIFVEHDCAGVLQDFTISDEIGSNVGAVAICLLFAVLLLAGIMRPWIGVFGYLFFAILCPQWNWRWSLPDWNFQKYLAAAALLGFLLSGVQYQRLPRWGWVAIYCLGITLFLNFASSFGTISVTKTAFFMDVFWKITLMTTLAAGVFHSVKSIRFTCIMLTIAQGWNALNVNQLYFQVGYLDLHTFTWNFLDSNTYSISTLPILAIALGLLFVDESRWIRTLAGLIIILQLHQLMLLESRGTMLGAILLAILAIVFMPKSRFNWTVVSLGIIATAVLAGPPVVREFASIFVAEGERDSSAESRKYLWQAGWEITRDHPLLGVGPWAGEKLVPSYYQGDMAMGSSKALHNLFFEMSTGAGVPAVLFYSGFFLAVWYGHWKLWRSSFSSSTPLRIINLAVLCGIPGFLFASMFSSGILIESPYVLAALGIAAFAADRLRFGESDENNEPVFSEDKPDA